MKLGRLQKRPGKKFLRLTDYMKAQLPAAPPSWDGTPGAVFGMYGNDKLGCCTCAGMANLASVQAAADGMPGLSFNTDDVVAFYENMTGGQDTGLVETDVLDRVLAKGFPLDGSWKIRTWAGIDYTNPDEVRAAAALFQGVYLGIQLPDDWQDGLDAGLWDVTGEPNPANGHCVVVVKFADNYGLATWGQVVPATPAWFAKYVDEAAVLLDDTRCSVDVLNGAGLIADAAALAAESGEGR